MDHQLNCTRTHVIKSLLALWAFTTGAAAYVMFNDRRWIMLGVVAAAGSLGSQYLLDLYVTSHELDCQSAMRRVSDSMFHNESE